MYTLFHYYRSLSETGFSSANFGTLSIVFESLWTMYGVINYIPDFALTSLLCFA